MNLSKHVLVCALSALLYGITESSRRFSKGWIKEDAHPLSFGEIPEESTISSPKRR